MGWLSLSLRSRLNDSIPHDHIKYAKDLEHAEYIEDMHLEYPPQDCSVPDSDLPFIPAMVSQGRAWIVVDNIVYDCTKFINEHPGGETVIRSFVGEDCSWQFWRFHDKVIMEQWGQPLRVGRTEGIRNRFKEIPKYFGPSKMR
ncbi:hypothetical protein ACMFMG_011732 [Clarireedia jacksonii]